jgi:uncharacterized membrane protein
MQLTSSLYVVMVCCFVVVHNMLPSVVIGFRIEENHVMGSFIICAFHVVIKS